MMTQADKQKRGAKFEREVAASLRFCGIWCHKLLTGYGGTPFDHIAINPNGIALAIENKTVYESRTLPYSRFKDKNGEYKEAKELTEFLKFGVPIVLCNYHNDKENICYVIEWSKVVDEFWKTVNCGQSGSIKLDKFPTIKRININAEDKKARLGWDLGILYGVVSK